MNETINTLESIFTGEGGTLRLAIVTSVFTAILYELLHSGYKLTANSSNGASVSLTPPIDKTAMEEPNAEKVASDDIPTENEDKAISDIV